MCIIKYTSCYICSLLSTEFACSILPELLRLLPSTLLRAREREEFCFIQEKHGTETHNEVPLENGISGTLTCQIWQRPLYATSYTCIVFGIKYLDYVSNKWHRHRRANSLLYVGGGCSFSHQGVAIFHPKATRLFAKSELLVPWFLLA